MACALIGKKLVRHVDFFGKYYKLSGIIVETEAYGGNNDPASHAFKKITNRNKVMFGNVGKVYVYYIYGNHYCFNIVAKQNDITAGAILIRSIQPTEGINLMRIFRRTENIMNLTTGPGKLTQAFKITKNHNGLDIIHINNNFFYLEDDQEEREYNKFKVLETTRIGISNAIEKKWRFIMMNQEIRKTNKIKEYIHNPFLSRRG